MSHLVRVVVDVASVFGCLLVVDFITGVFHWAEDTWTAPGRSTFLDRWVVIDNIEHHRKPGTIRAGDYWVTNRAGITMAAVTAGVLMLLHVHAWQAYLIVALASQANQIHLWAHSSSPPLVVRRLQRIGLLQSPAHHGEHHKRPYAIRFCTVTNVLNPLLDGIGFWRGLERLIQRAGVTLQRATPARGGY